jgi:hypothetical protein
MEFKKWLLSEMSHVTVPDDIELEIFGKRVRAMDMRFERYPERFKKFILGWFKEWSAVVPGQPQRLYFHNGNLKMVNWDKHLPHALPKDWWDYVFAIYKDGSLKQPVKDASLVSA